MVVQGVSIGRRLVWIEAALWWLAAILLIMALLTHSNTDPGWTHSASGSSVTNALGLAGAWVSDVMIALLGPVCWLVPVFLLQAPVQRLKGDHAQDSLWVFRFLGLGVALIAFAALARLHFKRHSDFLVNGSGGLVGELLGVAGWHAMGLAGSTVLFLGCALIGFVVAFDVDMLLVTEWVGRPLLWVLESMVHYVASQVHGLYSAWQQRMQMRQEFREQQEKFSLHISNPKVKQQLAKEREEPKVGHLSALEDTPVKVPVIPVSSPVLPEQTNPFTASKSSLKKVVPKPQPTIHAAVTSLEPSLRAERERQFTLFEGLPTNSDLPAVSLLDAPDHSRKRGYSQETLEGLSRLLELKLKEFNVDADVTAVQPGPVITRFEIQPAPGVKVARISNIAKDLARSLAVISVRVVEVIPGKSVVGIEIPNENREIVRLSEVLSSAEYDSRESPLTLVLGKDIGGRPVVADLARMPHLLVAGTTGSGKSVGVNAMLLSILYKATPEQVRLIMIDPKMLELSVYDGIPHLLTPVVTDMKEAANALRWSVAEMERRYKLLSKMGVRNLAGYNKKINEANQAGTPIRDPLWRPEDTGLQEEAPWLMPLPFIVVVVDEFADMMMVVGKKVEELIARIAQKARAAGIHLILATQRPSVDVITGLIKANIPTRIAFQVSSKIDSRTILDQGGADQLLGQGDMLFLPPGSGLPERVHGAFVADEEVHRVCNHWRSRGSPEYIDEILEGSYEVSDSGQGTDGEENAEQDPLYDQAVAFVLETRRASTSFVQRKFKIGYNRAARLVEAMEASGVVSSMQSNGQREVLVPHRE
ncbi:MAG: cell division protein FtsK [Pseudomonadales bacterium]|nr:cell division protein FtsK [Pseudomonadales bacterium]